MPALPEGPPNLDDQEYDVANDDNGVVDQDNNGELDSQVPNEGQLKFSEEEIQNLREIFDLFDKDHKGEIDMKDLEAIMQSL